ncbi:MAG: hypothetical protein IJM07_00840 [Pyramidobacter sp.]|nr:hypothetical protein [Pyramidobacter sp.]
MKKLLYFCASVLCLALAAGAVMLGGAGALRLLSSPKREEAAEVAASAAPAAPQAVTTPAPEPKPEPQTPKSEAAEKPAPALAPGMRVGTLDFERVMKNSVPGKAVSSYAEKYAAVMTKNITLLNGALKDRKKRYDTQAVKKAITQFTQQKSAVWSDAQNIVRGLVRTAAASSPLKDVLLIDRKDALYLPDELDRTDELIGLIDKLKLNLPDPPKPIELK